MTQLYSEKLEKLLLNKIKVLIIGPFFNNESVYDVDAIVLVDSGARYKPAIESKYPDVLMVSAGDADSHSPLDITFPIEKDESDLQVALKHIDKEVKYLYLDGFIGGRIDHQMIALGEIFNLYKSHFLIKKIVLDSTLLLLPKGEHKLKALGTFSLFSFEDAMISLSGNIQYRLEKVNVSRLSSLTLSNEASGEFFLNCDQSIFVSFVDKNTWQIADSLV